MIRLEIKSCTMILTEKQQKYQHYPREKLTIECLTNEYLTNEEIFPSNQRQTIEHAKLKYSPLGKFFEKKKKPLKSKQKNKQMLLLIKTTDYWL